MAKSESTAVAQPTTIPEIQKVAAALQIENAKDGEPPLTGTELAEQIGAMQPAPPPAGSKYRITEIVDGKPDETKAVVVVDSADGSIEDAIRAFNQNRPNSIRTAKQLRIELLPPKAA